jgi:hypothetical protein
MKVISLLLLGIDIAVGRMLVNDAKQANKMINKVLEYHNSESFGSWRNNFIISDDSDVVSMPIYKTK